VGVGGLDGVRGVRHRGGVRGVRLRGRGRVAHAAGGRAGLDAGSRGVAAQVSRFVIYLDFYVYLSSTTRLMSHESKETFILLLLSVCILNPPLHKASFAYLNITSH